MSNKNKNKKFDQREADERKEGYDTVKTNLPKESFQGEKQVLTPDELGVNKSAIAGTDGPQTAQKPETMAAKVIKSKIKIRPDAAVEELNDKQVGGVPLAGAMSTRSVAGVSNMSPADDVSKIPYSGGNYRPSSRYGKKRSEDLFILDNQIAEQIVPAVEDSLDLRDAPDAKQGYNGRKQFKQVRGKKNFAYTNGTGNVVPRIPQQLLNEASVDFIHTSKRIYTSGQMINSTNDVANNASPTSVKIPKGSDYPSVKHDGTATTFRMHKGNYQPKTLVIKTANNKISEINILEDYYELHTDPIARDEANMNLRVDTNNVAKSVVRLQNELGRETTDKWSPLGYVIYEPYEYNMLMHDIEASTGAIMATAYRSACSSMSFQRNIAGKDGVNPQRNAVKMILEGYAGVMESNDSTSLTDSEFDHMIWNQAEYRKGSVAAIIKMFDTTGKYKTKADILGLQRGLSLHLSQADNNINPLHCKPQFIKTLNKAHMFSTIDGTYNPLLPIFSTRKISLVNPLSLNAFLIGWKNPADLTAQEKADPLRDETTGTYANFSYKYDDLRNKYTTRVQHPLVEGLLLWLLKHEGAFVSTFGNNATINIPFEFNFESPNLLSFMLCSAAQEILWERNITFRDIIFAGQQSEYIWPDLEGLDKLNPLYSSQLKINGYTEPLTLGKLAPDTVVRELWSDQMQMTANDNGKAQYMMPWQFNERAFGSVSGGSYTQNEGFFVEDTAFNMSIPSIREGVRHEYVDVVKSMSERDIRLSLDRRVDIPVFHTTTVETVSIGGSNKTLWTKYTNYATSTALNNYVKLSTLRYDANSDGRLIARYDLTDGSNRDLSQKSLYLCAKEIGFIDDDYEPFDVITLAAYNSGNNTVALTTTTLQPFKYVGLNNTAAAYNGHAPVFITSYRVQSDSSSTGNIDRAAALTQVFYRCFANVNANTAAINQKFIAKTGIIPCLGYNDGNPLDVKGVYSLGSNNESSHVIDLTIRTIANRIWTMIQRFFMPINRFENIFNINSKVDFDPLETAFYFGVCGTLASDYTQDVLERLDACDQLGLDYTEDYFCKDSLIFRLD